MWDDEERPNEWKTFSQTYIDEDAQEWFDLGEELKNFWNEYDRRYLYEDDEDDDEFESVMDDDVEYCGEEQCDDHFSRQDYCRRESGSECSEESCYTPISQNTANKEDGETSITTALEEKSILLNDEPDIFGINQRFLYL
jgi:hypothetical protein